ncbi:hypothetical protein BB558_004488 [Smittium angustum]|uniref:Pentafunctional AROM polypeptide n=1 Tax=Smittium angustum TaxID=133377 RepID=A0A2U1J3D0_SMIAN|nr:hypothetical protein BB558_004488 [Smittium angustum]
MPEQKQLSPMFQKDGVNHISVMGEDSIIIGKNMIDFIWNDLVENFAYSSVYIIVIDQNLADHYLDRFTESFKKTINAKYPGDQKKPKLDTQIIHPGEVSKSRNVKERIEDRMLNLSCTRDTFVLAIGGGVVGDLAGFVAATFMRGIRYVQIPTSLLAMVDSSIGGKTAIDTFHGKNLIGSFWQPKRIYMDVDFLKTLPMRELSNGMAEVIKSAAIWSIEEFEILEKHSKQVKDAVLGLGGKENADLLIRVVSGSARMKAHVVTVDERETGLRGLLNFGHTIGHALEAIVAPHLLHGECVSIGCILEAELAHRLGHLKASAVARLARCFKLYNLPTEIYEQQVLKLVPNKVMRHVNLEKLMDNMKVDKKNIGTNKRVVLLSRIGDTVEEKPTPVSDESVMEVLASVVEVVGIPENDLDEWKSKHGKDGIVLSPPGSKSISNRALVLAALGQGTCRIHNLLHSDDTRVMIDALTALGACTVEAEEDGEVLVVTGNGGKMLSTKEDIYLGNAGTAARFLTTMVNLAQVGSSDYSIVTGNARMKERPIAGLVDSLTENGCKIDYLEKSGSLPLKIHHTGTMFPGGHIQLAASVSSQYVSSILMCAPYAQKPVTLELIGGHVVSQPYIDMTIAMMKSFGIQVKPIGKNTYSIPLGNYVNPTEYEVESDASSATYPLAIAAITSTKCTIPNIGSSSLQGDARFAIDVLRPMGCTVTQTKTSTTVEGPPFGTLKPLGEIDMEPMTDAFLTASVLAAVATNNKSSTGDNWTKIRGIANQHVKECDRILAMATELGKLGIKSKIHEDGIDIEGQPISQIVKNNTKPSIHCYDDHRVAMSMSVLATAVHPGLVIKERRCVGKTWPTWWTALAQNFGVTIKGCNDTASEVLEEKKKPILEKMSLVLIGMRGVGKSTLGMEMAQKLGYKFVDLDSYLEESLGKKIPEIIESEGWESFRAHETAILGKALFRSYSSETVIASGGGAVESKKSVDVLNKWKANGGVILHLYADINHVSDYLDLDKTRPAYSTGETAKQTFERRLPLYKELSTHTLFVHSESPFGWSQMIEDANRMALFMLAGCNSVELRADLFLKSKSFEGADLSDDSKFAEFEFYVLEQLSALRRRTKLPIIYTVRSKSQGGAFPNLLDRIETLLRRGIEWGCEYVDVEMSRDEYIISRVSKYKQRSLIIASYHDTKGLEIRWDYNDPTLPSTRYLEQALRYGDVAKLISVALEWNDNLRCFLFARRHRSDSKIPLIAINMGYTGQFTRVMNSYMTPVTHPSLTTAAAPGQLSVVQIHQSLSTLGAIPPRNFFLFGEPISASPSPDMHNSAFMALGLPHKFYLYPVDLSKSTPGDDTFKALTNLIRSSEFGGAAITIPNKEYIGQLLDGLTPAAKAIGAINTIVVRNKVDEISQISPASSYLLNSTKVKLVGDNTDYLGIIRSLTRANKASSNPQSFGKNTQALIIGAGGTTRAALYAMYTLGIKNVYLFNRTKAKAESLAKDFSDLLPQIEVVESLDQEYSSKDKSLALNYSVIISTVPAVNTAFEYPESLFTRGNTPKSNEKEGSTMSKIALDMAYKPTLTPLLEKSASHKWVTVPGFLVLVDQGIEQSARWTNVFPPEKVMYQAVLNRIQN